MSEQLTRERRPARSGAARTLVLVVAVLVAYAVVGLLAGFVWETVWNPPAQTVQQHLLYYDDYESLRRGFSGTGLYVVVAVAASALVALVVGLVSRGRELPMLLVVILGAALAAFVMWKVGTTRGPADPTALAKTAADGTKVSGNLTVSGHTPYVAWPITSLFVMALVFLAWSGGKRPRQVAPEVSSTSHPESPVGAAGSE